MVGTVTSFYPVFEICKFMLILSVRDTQFNYPHFENMTIDENLLRKLKHYVEIKVQPEKVHFDFNIIGKLKTKHD